MVEVQDLLFYFEVAAFFFGDATYALVDEITCQLLALYLKYFVDDFLKKCDFSGEV